MERQESEFTKTWKGSLLIGAVLAALSVALYLLFYTFDFDKTADAGNHFLSSLLLLWTLGVIAFQAYIYKRQMHAMERGLAQNERFFESVERPWLGVDFADIIVSEMDRAGIVRVRVKNYGKSPAVNVREKLQVDFARPSKRMAHLCHEPKLRKGILHGIDSRSVIAPGRESEMRSLGYDQRVMEKVARERVWLMVWYRCNYESTTGRKFSCEFYARFKPEMGMFETCQNHNGAYEAEMKLEV